MKKLSKKNILIVLSFILGFSILSHSNFFHYQGKISEKPRNINEPELKHAGYWNVTPFTINGNSGWEALNSSYDWCSGSGTLNDPYIIQNLSIDALGVNNCIYILNTDVFFEIRNCSLTNASALPDKGGIRLANVQNGIISENNITISDRGIFLEFNIYNVNISSNTINNCYGAIWYESRTSDMNFINNIIAGNIISECDNGVFVDIWSNNCEGNNNTIKNNFINMCQSGIYLGGYGIISDNNIYNNTISNHHNGGGITVGGNSDECYYNNIFNNSLNNLQHGLKISGGNCRYNNIQGNVINNISVCGLMIDSCYYNNFQNNIINNSGGEHGVSHAVRLWSGSYCNFTGNTIENSEGEYALSLLGAEFNLIYNNSFINNNVTSQAFDERENNQWDNGSIGNYWDDYSGVDLNDDGIGDIPYIISSLDLPNPDDVLDNYPI